MARIWTRLAALAALFIGVMAVVAGAPVLLGRHPGWHVIGWVPAYNLTMGFISALVTSVLLWLGRPGPVCWPCSRCSPTRGCWCSW